jgi:predicted nucleotidyltransferase
MVENIEATKQTIREMYPYLKNHFGINRIGIFGSFSAGTVHENSDIDLIVEFVKPIGFQFMNLAEFLEKKLGRKVDILTPEGLKTIRVKQVADRIRSDIVYV